MLFRLLCGLLPDWNAFLRRHQLEGEEGKKWVLRNCSAKQNTEEKPWGKKREGGGEGCYVDVATADPGSRPPPFPFLPPFLAINQNTHLA